MRHGLGAALVVLVVAGCSDPYASEPPESSPRPRATPAAWAPRPAAGDAVPVVVTAEPSRAPVDRRATRSPAALARAYAQLVINWDWRTLTGRLERAQSLAAGALREELVHTIGTARADESVRRDRAGASGRVVSVAANGAASTRHLVVVTSEQALRDGRATLEGPRARVYTGTARRTSGGWRMVAWELEP